MDSDFKRIDRELVYKGTIIDFYKDTIQVPNGNVVKWDFIAHKGAAAMVAVREDGKLLLVRQFRNALDRYTLELPAGGLNGSDEPTKVAAIRELEEETGYRCEDADLLISIRTTVAFCNEKIDIYVTNQLEKTSQNLDEDEFIGVEAYAVEELLDMIYSGQIEDSKTVAGIMAYYNKYCK